MTTTFVFAENRLDCKGLIKEFSIDKDNSYYPGQSSLAYLWHRIKGSSFKGLGPEKFSANVDSAKAVFDELDLDEIFNSKSISPSLEEYVNNDPAKQVALIEFINDQLVAKNQFPMTHFSNEAVTQRRIRIYNLVKKYDILKSPTKNNLEEFYAKLYSEAYAQDIGIKNLFNGTHKERVSQLLAHRFQRELLKKPMNEILTKFGMINPKNTMWSHIKRIYRHQRMKYIEITLESIGAATLTATTGLIILPTWRNLEFTPTAKDLEIIMQLGWKEGWETIKENYQIRSSLETYQNMFSTYYNIVAIGFLSYFIYDQFEVQKSISIHGQELGEIQHDFNKGRITIEERDQLIANNLISSISSSSEIFLAMSIMDRISSIQNLAQKYQIDYAESEILKLPPDQQKSRREKKQRLSAKIDSKINKALSKIEQYKERRLLIEETNELIDYISGLSVEN